MLKKTLALMLTAVMLLSGCNGNTSQTTTESVVAPSEAWDYEMYVEDLDYYMEQYFQSFNSARSASLIQDTAAAKKYLESEIDALNDLENVIYPPDLEAVHNEFLYTVGLAKELAEYNLDITDYMEKGDSLTSDDYSALDALTAEANNILAEIDECGGIGRKWLNAQSAALAYLPNGEYIAYVSELETLWDTYITESDILTEVFFNGANGNALNLSDNCLSLLSSIENMEVPESVKSYHDGITEAISTERNLYQAIKTIVELNNEYQGVEFENTPVDVQNKVQECSETIDAFYNEENVEYYALYEAVYSALEFAETQIK